MREAMGNTFIYNMVLIFVGIAMLLLVGSISYTKAYKVKNRIISIIEENQDFNTKAKTEIETDLKSIGYRLAFKDSSCPELQSGGEKGTLLYGSNPKGYHYCVYQFNTLRGKYYHIKTFMHFDIPLIGGFIEFPVSGETRIFYEELRG